MARPRRISSLQLNPGSDSIVAPTSVPSCRSQLDGRGTALRTSALATWRYGAAVARCSLAPRRSRRCSPVRLVGRLRLTAAVQLRRRGPDRECHREGAADEDGRASGPAEQGVGGGGYAASGAVGCAGLEQGGQGCRGVAVSDASEDGQAG